MTLLLVFLMVAAITLFISKAKNPSAYWMSLILLGWFLSMAGLILFIAKYGGFYYKVNIVLFFNDTIRSMLLHSPFHIGDISRMITIGRSVFIFSLIGLSLTLFNHRSIHRLKEIYVFNLIPAVCNIIFYDPVVYKWFLSVSDRRYSYLISWITRSWIIISAVFAVSLMIWRYRKITVPWFRKQIQHILIGVLALVVFYFYLGFLGPLQVTDIRTYYVLYSDFSNYNPPLSVFEWYISIGIIGITSIISLFSIWKYTEVEKNIGRMDLHLERKFKIANMGSKVFTHAIKNQLIMVQLLLKKIQAADFTNLDQPQEVKGNVTEAAQIVNETLARLDQLYNSLKINYLHLKPIVAADLLDKISKKLKLQFDKISIDSHFTEQNPLILGDYEHLAEAIYNVALNAIEAVKDKDHRFISISSYVEENWYIIKIQDHGVGISQDQMEYIFDPFYTSKNTKQNWGVGLSYVKQIIHGHYGQIQVESKSGKGSTFYMLLPVYLVDQKKVPKDEER